MFCSCFNYINCLSFSQNINHYCSQKDVPPKKVPEVDQELGEGESFVILRPPPPGNQKITNPRSMRGGGGGKWGTKNLFVLIVPVVYRT